MPSKSDINILLWFLVIYPGRKNEKTWFVNEINSVAESPHWCANLNFGIDLVNFEIACVIKLILV